MNSQSSVLPRAYRFFSTPIISISLTFSVLITSAAEPDVVELSNFLPQEKADYWSYIGYVEADDSSADMNIRRSVSSTTLIDNKRTHRVSQELVSSTLEENTDLESLNKLSFTTTNNGWRIFAEETDNKLSYFNRSALILPAKVSVGDSQKYKTRLDPDYGQYGLISYFTSVIGFEDIDIPNGTVRALKINQEKKTKIAEDEKLQSITSQSTEYGSYWLAEGIGIVKQDSTLTTFGTDGSNAITYNVELAATNYLPNYLWPEAIKTEDGWTHVSWFGYITDNYFPWVFHEKHGWLYVDAEDTDEIHLWSETLGWWLTSKDTYPTFFAVDINDWLTFNEDSTVERQFVKSDGTILTASTYGFRFRPNSSLPPETTIESPYEQTGFDEFEDSRGNRYIDSDAGLTPDQGEIPEVSIISPLDGTLINEDQKIAILADAFDKDGEISLVKIVVNGRTIEVVDSAPYYTYFSPDPTVEDYTLYAVAVDNNGNEAQSQSISFALNIADQKPPKVRIAAPLNKTYYKFGDKVWVEIVASDEDGFLEQVALLVDGIQVGDEKANPPYTFGFIPPVTGSFSIGASAIDDDGNETNANSITINVNETGIPDSSIDYPPEVRISSPINRAIYSAGDSVQIKAVASDEDGSIERVQIFVDGIQVGGDFDSAPYELTYTPPTSGTYQISAKARDNLRNESNSSTISITVE